MDSELPLHIGCEVKWWDTWGEIKYGTVEAINTVGDGSKVILIQTNMKEGPLKIQLPVDHVQLK
ncbi:hypothetical protein BJV77DRAFT_159801 [Russula vinacea]|nr:hypothetical protein BJV77DRAFT_159801 [Russula vinacea]